MGFRDDVEAARARAEALERDNADLRREVEKLREKLLERDQPTEQPRRNVVERQKTVAYMAILALVAVAAAFLLVAWGSHLQLVPDPVVMNAPVLLALLGIAFVALSIAGLWLGGRPFRTSTGYDLDMMISEIWVWVPFVLGFPVIGTIMALARAVILFRGRFEGCTITTLDGGDNEVTTKHYEPRQLTQREGWPAALVFLTLAVVWPGMVASVMATDWGSPDSGQSDTLSAPVE